MRFLNRLTVANRPLNTGQQLLWLQSFHDGRLKRPQQLRLFMSQTDRRFSSSPAAVEPTTKWTFLLTGLFTAATAGALLYSRYNTKVNCAPNASAGTRTASDGDADEKTRKLVVLSDSASQPSRAGSQAIHSNLLSVQQMFDGSAPSVAFSHRSTFDLLRSALIFELCQFPQIVDYTPRLINFAASIGLQHPLYWLVRRTFFQQFCGGQTADEVVPTMQSIKAVGIGSILDLSVEADDTNENGEPVMTVDQKADYITTMIQKCIDTASQVTGSFAAIKVTALGSTKALKNLSHVMQFTRDVFHAEASADATSVVNINQFQNIIKRMPGYSTEKFSDQSLTTLFRSIDKDGDGLVDWVDFSDTINIDNPQARDLFIGRISLPSISAGSVETYWSISALYNPEITRENLMNLEKIERRLDSLCAFAQSKGVALMIDAEQSYFQPAIDYLTIKMMKKYNALTDQSPRVYNTYQMYLKDGYSRLLTDMKRAERDTANYTFAVKLVRGAYMTSERARAESLQIKDPIQESKEDTHRAYDAAVEAILLKSATSNATNRKLPIAFIIASHNRSSIISACSLMQDLAISKRGIVKFAQLYGMHDYLSFTLAKNGYEICKYIPYGAVEDVIPYLLRRAQENRSVLQQSKTGIDDRTLLWRELKSRIFGR